MMVVCNLPKLPSYFWKTSGEGLPRKSHKGHQKRESPGQPVCTLPCYSDCLHHTRSQDFGSSISFVAMFRATLSQEITPAVNKWNPVKLRSFCTVKAMVNRAKKQSERQSLPAIHLTEDGNIKCIKNWKKKKKPQPQECKQPNQYMGSRDEQLVPGRETQMPLNT